MIDKEYLVENEFEFGFSLGTSLSRIPCFVDFEYNPAFGENIVKIHIRCREYDLGFVEECLAPFV